MALTTNEWARESFGQFITELISRIGAHNAALRLNRYFLFFAKLDSITANPKSLTVEDLIEHFGLEGIRRHAIPYGFLVKSEILPRHPARLLRKATETENQRLILVRAERFWYHDLLCNFCRHQKKISERYEDHGWVGQSPRYTPQTVTGNLRSAAKLLESLRLDTQSIRQIDQCDIDLFLTQSPGYRDSIRAFVRYLNREEKLFRKIQLDKVARNLPPNLFLEPQKYKTLLKTWLSPPQELLKESLICLMMLLYAQKANKLVQLKLSDISRTRDGVFKIILAKSEISLDKRIGTLLDDYLKTRKALSSMEDEWENDYLFPGRAQGSYLSEATVTYYLKKYDISAEMLFASAIHYAYLNGMRHPKVLVKALGISDLTAIKYLNLINPRLRDEMETKVSAC